VFEIVQVIVYLLIILYEVALCDGQSRAPGFIHEKCKLMGDVSAGYGQPLACAAVLQPVPISCHFRGCKAPLSSIVNGAISSELPLPFYPLK